MLKIRKVSSGITSEETFFVAPRHTGSPEKLSKIDRPSHAGVERCPGVSRPMASRPRGNDVCWAGSTRRSFSARLPKKFAPLHCCGSNRQCRPGAPPLLWVIHSHRPWCSTFFANHRRTQFPAEPVFGQRMQSFQKATQPVCRIDQEVSCFADSCEENAMLPPWVPDKIASVAIGTALAVVRGAMVSPGRR